MRLIRKHREAVSLIVLPGLIVVFGLGLLGLSSVVQPAGAQQASASTLLVNQTSLLGAILTDPHGMTLYVRASDTVNTSTCSGQCASVWPPFQPPGPKLTQPNDVAGTLGIMARNDGIEQVTYNGMPLYHYTQDALPGDTNGEGIDGLWSVATP
jgi:predicted lipoprotein with Yx(FWY)xxD motif